MARDKARLSERGSQSTELDGGDNGMTALGDIHSFDALLSSPLMHVFSQRYYKFISLTGTVWKGPTPGSASQELNLSAYWKLEGPKTACASIDIYVNHHEK